MAIAQITLRSGTTAEWNATNPVLAAGEPGYDKTLKRMKVGDGASQWTMLKWQDVDSATLTRVEAAAEAIEGATTPTDGVMAAVAADPASAFATELSTTIDGAIADAFETYVPPSAYPPELRPLTSKVYPMALPLFTAALEAVKAGTRNARILVVDDSTAQGVGSGSIGYDQGGSWPHHMAGRLDQLFIPSANGLQTPSAASRPDNRWTGGAGWSRGGGLRIGFGFKNAYWSQGPNQSGSLTFNDPRIMADRFDIYYVQYAANPPAHAMLSASATGGAIVDQTTAGGIVAGSARVAKITISAATAATTNVVTIRNTATTGNPLYVVAIEPWLSTEKKVLVGNAGISGSNTSDWVAQFDANTDWASTGAIKAYAPDLTIIGLGINDAETAHNTDPAVYLSRLNTLASAAAVSGDVIFKTMLPSSGYRAAREAEYVAAVRGSGKPYIDIFGRYGSFEFSNAAGFMADELHGNAAGYRDKGYAMADVVGSLV